MPTPCRSCAGPAWAAAVAATAATLLAGCSDRIEADIRQRFAEKYERPLCVKLGPSLPATVSVNPMNKETLAWLSALEGAGLVTARELPPDRRAFFRDRRFEFALTEAGQRQFQPERGFCYGRAEIVEVIDYTEPSQVSGVATVQAQARLRRHIDAAWARDPAVAGLVASGDEKVDMVLVKKAKGGWSPAY
ncbi:MAG: hypothetical protein KIS83_14820 [Rubrivivax sp.]|nr:hypothetical protein [Rubrivivax sp.]MCW5611927.1 hypothetical protein [Rubrivivax sp.]